MTLTDDIRADSPERPTKSAFSDDSMRITLNTPDPTAPYFDVAVYHMGHRRWEPQREWSLEDRGEGWGLFGSAGQLAVGPNPDWREVLIQA